MSLTTSFEPLQTIRKAAVSRWKLETLTGLLGMRSLQNHQAETAKNVAAENRHVRRTLWGETEPTQSGDEMGGNTILGDNINPTPIIVNGQQSSGVGKVLAGAAIGAALLGIPAAGIGGYVINEMLNKPKAAPQTPVENETLNLGLLRIEDLTE